MKNFQINLLHFMMKTQNIDYCVNHVTVLLVHIDMDIEL